MARWIVATAPIFRIVPRWNLSIILVIALISIRPDGQGREYRRRDWSSGDRTPGGRLRKSVDWAAKLVLFILSVRWGWPACETLHFIGLCLLFQALPRSWICECWGIIKGVSFAALHRLMPWGDSRVRSESGYGDVVLCRFPGT